MRVAIRVDASPAIGTGHLARSLTLAQALIESGASVTLICRHLPGALAALVTPGCALVRLPARPTESDGDLAHRDWLGTRQLLDAEDTAAALAGGQWDWVIVDHYALDARWERAIGAGPICVIDDLADRNHDANLLVDQNLRSNGAEAYRSRVPPGCRVLAGPRYALLRDEFGRGHDRAAPRTGEVARLLVGYGGIDADNHTARAIDALAAGPRFAGGVDVVIGAAHVDRDGIAARCAQLGFRCHVQTAALAELMAAADLAIGAGGITLWERCCLGLPALVTTVGLNQSDQVREAAVAGLVSAPVGLAAGGPEALLDHLRTLLHNPYWRESLSRRGLDAVDGRGAGRVVRAMGAADVHVRRAHTDDAAALFAWRNDPSVRSVSRSREPLDPAQHDAWLARVLADPQRILLIGERDGHPVGVVRFDVEGTEAEVSIFLTPGTHRPGTGSALLSSAERHLASARPEVTHCRAQVLGDNRRSHGLFAGGGYAPASAWYQKTIRNPA